MIDFADLKARVSITDVAEFLDLKTRERNGEHRAPCPACNEGGERALQLNADNTFKCWVSKRHGDIIGLVAHVTGVGIRQAAESIADHFKVGKEYKPQGKSSPSPTPQPTQEPVAGTEQKTGLAPIAHLDPKHEMVKTVGFDPDVAEKLGVGYAAKGILKGTVGIPVRDSTGTLTGYLGVTTAKHPKAWKL